MKGAWAVAIALGLLAAGVLEAYLWRSHNRMAYQGRDVFLGNESTHQPPFSIDQELKDFLDDYGGDLDTRAGDSFDKARTDEDETEGTLSSYPVCVYTEAPCFSTSAPISDEQKQELNTVACTKDHFQPKLNLPLGQEDAITHAFRYFNWAVTLYKAGKCSKNGRFLRDSARALGHAVHLVHDMGCPQHTRPENHAPYPIGNGLSFLEFWTLDVWDVAQTYPKDGSPAGTLGPYERAASQAKAPQLGSLPVIMGNLAAHSSLMPFYGPSPPGLELPFPELQRVLHNAHFFPRWLERKDKDGNIIGVHMWEFSTDFYPDYYEPPPVNSGMHAKTHGFGSPVVSEPDYVADWAATVNDTTITVQSYELSTRLWAEWDSLYPWNPGTFDVQLANELTLTTEAAAGTILAFWDLVKDFKCPKCYKLDPCGRWYKWDREPRCRDQSSGNKRPPDNDHPDEAAGILEGPSPMVALEQTRPLNDEENPPRHELWPEIARVGIGHGVASLADYGRTMRLITIGSDPGITEEDAHAVSAELGRLERAYGSPRPRPEEEIAKGAHIALFDSGFVAEAGALLDAMHQPYVSADVTFDPLALAANHDVLLVPSGGLYGAASSGDLRERFAAYASAGGTLVVMAQMRGEDFEAVPVPSGESLKAFGWAEDQSCWRDNVVVAEPHPIVASATKEMLSVAVDGFIEVWPSSAHVPLRRAGSGTAVLVAYPLGDGWVVVTTSYHDWGRANGQDGADGLALFADLVSWAIDPDADLVVCHLGELCADEAHAAVANLTDTAADTVEWQLWDASRSTLVTSWRESVALVAGAVAEVDVTPPLSPPTPGIHHLDFRLLDSARQAPPVPPATTRDLWEVQPQGEAAQLVVEDWPDSLRSLPRVSLGLAVEEELAIKNSYIPIHVSARNLGDQEVSGVIQIDQRKATQETWRSLTSIAVGPLAPDEALVTDLTVGPLLLSSGHDGLPGGGWVRARFVADPGGAVLATAAKGLKEDTKQFELMLAAAVQEAIPGDVVELGTWAANRSLGELRGTHRLVITATLDLTTGSRARVELPWRPFLLVREGTLEETTPFTVPVGWQGVLTARVEVCLDGEACATSPLFQAKHRAGTTVSLPASTVALDLLDLTVSPGLTAHVPAQIRNIGRRLVEGGKLRLRQKPAGGAEVWADVPTLAENEATTVLLDLPLAPDPSLDDAFRIEVTFTDPSWSATTPIDAVPFRLQETLNYGLSCTVPQLAAVEAGATAIPTLLELRSRASIPLVLTVHLTSADLEYDEQRTVELAPFSRTTLSVEVPVPPDAPPTTYALDVTVSDGVGISLLRTVVLQVKAPRLELACNAAGAPFRQGGTFRLEAQISGARLAGPITGVLTLSLPELSLAVEKLVTIVPGERTIELFEVPLPEDLGAGNYTWVVEWHRDTATLLRRLGWFFIAPARLEVTLPVDSAGVGETLNVALRNTGGVRGEFELRWGLQLGRTTVQSGATTVTVAAGETVHLPIALDGTLAGGSYSLLVQNRLPDWFDWWANWFTVTVLADAPQLDVTTGSPSYAAGAPIDGHSTVVAGATNEFEGTLRLAVAANRKRAPGKNPWPTFQGGGARSGAAPGGRVIEPARLGEPPAVLASVAEIPMPGWKSPARATADLTGDGIQDVVDVAWDGAGTSRVTLWKGPTLTEVASLTLPGKWQAVDAVAVGNRDGAGRDEVFVVHEAPTSGDDTDLMVTCYTSALQQVWAVHLPLSFSYPDFLWDLVYAYPEGGPLPIELDGSPGVEVLVTTVDDLMALDGSDGHVLWRLSDRAPLPGITWAVTGVASADTDADGLGEIAVGLKILTSPATGAILMLDVDGAVQWGMPGPAATAGSPVLFQIPSQGWQVAAIFSEELGDGARSTLALWDAFTGIERWTVGGFFWSEWPPAAADINGDGAIEIVVASGSAQGYELGLFGAAAFSTEGVELWRTESNEGAQHDYRPTSPPVLTDIDGDDQSDVLFVERGPGAGGIRAGMGFGPTVRALRGFDGTLLALGESSSMSDLLVIADVDGDSLPEILAGAFVLSGLAKAMCSEEAWFPDCRDVLWTWSGPVALAPAAAHERDHAIDPISLPGDYLLLGALRNRFGQTVATSETSFAVAASVIGVSLAQPEDVVIAGASLEVSGTLANTGSATREVRLLVRLDGTTVLDRRITVGAGSSVPFSGPLPAVAAGLHQLLVQASATGVPTATLDTRFLAEEPTVNAEIAAPASATALPFTVRAELRNPTHLPLALTVSLGADGMLSGSPVSLLLDPQGIAPLEFTTSILQDTTFALRAEGDAALVSEFGVLFDPQVALNYVGDSALLAGESVIPIEVINLGEVVRVGLLRWSLTGSTEASGELSVALDPFDSRVIEVLVPLNIGPSVLRVAFEGANSEAAIEALPGGRGSVELAVPAQALEGPVEIPVAVTNLGPIKESFLIEVVAEALVPSRGARAATRGARTTATQKQTIAVTLAGGASAAESASFNLGVGTYTVTASLNGGPPIDPPMVIEVLPAHDLTVTAAAGVITASETLPVQIEVSNAGALEAPGLVRVSGSEEDVAVPLTVPAGGQADASVELDVAALALGENDLTVEFLGAGLDPVCGEPLDVTVVPARLELAGGPRTPAVQAGDVLDFDFLVANRGALTGNFELDLDVADGAVLRDDVEGVLGPGGEQAIHFAMAVPADAPGGTLPAEAGLIAETDPTAYPTTVASGRFDVTVLPTPVEVLHELSATHVGAGDVTHLTLTLSCPNAAAPVPLVAFLTYLPWEERREVVAGPEPAETTFEVPIERPGGMLGIAITWPTGRVAYLDALPIYSADGPVRLTADREEYVPGDTAVVTAELLQPGTLEVVTLDSATTLTSSGAVTVPIPAGTPRGRIPVPWTFRGVAPDSVFAEGVIVLPVRGPLVKILSLELPAGPFAPQELVTATVTVTADTALEGEIVAWVRSPSGVDGEEAVRSLNLSPGHGTVITLDLPLETTEAGTHEVVVEIDTPASESLASARALLDVVGGWLLGLQTDRLVYPGADDPVNAMATVQGHGPARLELLLDGTRADARVLHLDGVGTESFVLAGLSPGRHTLEGMLDASGVVTRATAAFRIGTALPDLAVGLTAVADESGVIRGAASIRNAGSAEAPPSRVVITDIPSEGEAGVVLTNETPVLLPGDQRYVPLDIVLPIGFHELEAVIDEADAIEEFDETNNAARVTVEVTTTPPPTPTPTPAAASIRTARDRYRPGETVEVEGTAPDGAYCLAVIPNARWDVPCPAPADPKALHDVASVNGVIESTVVWPQAEAGSWDAVLISGACGQGGEVVAAWDAGETAGFVVTDEAAPIPATGALGLVALAAVLGLLALRALQRRRAAILG